MTDATARELLECLHLLCVLAGLRTLFAFLRL
jgi:hypothetical protein